MSTRIGVMIAITLAVKDSKSEMRSFGASHCYDHRLNMNATVSGKYHRLKQTSRTGNKRHRCS
eukprot:6316646-Heterocapsa_arctica.AAC.1